MSIENLEMLDGIDESFIASAENVKKKRPIRKLALPAAAALLLAFGAVLGIKAITKRGDKPPVSALVTVEPTATAAPAATAIPTETAAPTETVDPAGESAFADRIYLSKSDNGFEDDSYPPDPQDSIQWGIDYRMFIYNGREYFMFATVDQLKDIIGVKLGTVEEFDFIYSAHMSSDDEAGSSQQDDEHPPYILISENELKGTVKGNIFTVKGFSSDEMICMRNEYLNYIMLFTTGAGITSNNGASFFEDVLHVSETLTGFTYYSNSIIYPRDGAARFALDPEIDPVSLLIRAIDEAEWIDDTRSVGSRFYNDRGDSVKLYCAVLVLSSKLDIDVTVYEDGVITIGSGFNSKALKADTALLQPILELMNANEGEPLEKSSELEALQNCIDNDSLGYAVPRKIPKGLHITHAGISYSVDSETGALANTEVIKIDYKDRDHDSIIWFYIWPQGSKASEYDLRFALEKGAKLVELEDFNKDCMYIRCSYYNDEEGYVYCSWTVVTYKDALIFVEAIDTDPDVVVELLGSIME